MSVIRTIGLTAAAVGITAAVASRTRRPPGDQPNLGSHSTGAGAGKVTFNPFSITRRSQRR